MKKRVNIIRNVVNILILGALLISCDTITDSIKPKYSIITVPSSGGTIGIQPQKTQYYEGDTITITATPNVGYSFTSWSGSLNGLQNPLIFEINGDTTVSAIFSIQSIQSYTITKATSAYGSITVSPNKSSYSSGEIVQITAIPNTEYTFTNWAGDLSGTSNPINITISKNYLISANYALIFIPNLAATITNSGGSNSFNSNYYVTFTITNTGNVPFYVSSATLNIRGSTGSSILFSQTSSTLNYSTIINVGNSYSYTINGNSAPYIPYYFDASTNISDGYGNTKLYSGTMFPFTIY